ncbi:NAD(P)/FAD-dependent oxidoreductase [Actinoplanes sp. NPDC051859]|uniref:NAD(P)/FAD-dependent oxidoreductase n=1 Tax=Actinoplanes sp. NPDC051859 TaxID=3363909 RepID=UPI0037B6939E
MPSPRHAVVIGGSLAGLCAARVLADHVDRVTVVDRDDFPAGPTVRKGLPQAHHLHVLIPAGQLALDRLFPGLMAGLHERGAVPVAAPTEVLYLSPTGWRDRFPATHRLVGASRELIDWSLRRWLAEDGRVQFRTGHEVAGLLPATGTQAVDGGLPPVAGAQAVDGGLPPVAGAREVGGGLPSLAGARAVGGVLVRERSAGSRLEELAADLVVDASGRASRAADWLEKLGYGRPRESRVESGLAYASRRYTLPEGATGGWKCILLMPKAPDIRRAGVLLPIENGKWMVTLGGLGGDVPPTDEPGFLEFARTLRSPVLYEAIKNGTPDSPIHGYRRTANHRRHYESMPHWPDGFLVVGDAACTFNPVYGQGMTVAAQAAVQLDEHLRAHPGTFGRAAQAAVAQCSVAPWQIATGADLRFPSTVGPRPGWSARLSNWYLDRTADVGNHDEYVARVFADVLYLLAPPTALFRPGVAARVLRGRRGPALPDAPAPVGTADK